jgi:hypothetical protein
MMDVWSDGPPACAVRRAGGCTRPARSGCCATRAR